LGGAVPAQDGAVALLLMGKADGCDGSSISLSLSSLFARRRPSFLCRVVILDDWPKTVAVFRICLDLSVTHIVPYPGLACKRSPQSHSIIRVQITPNTTATNNELHSSIIVISTHSPFHTLAHPESRLPPLQVNYAVSAEGAYSLL
jgi:hypothetical protein